MVDLEVKTGSWAHLGPDATAVRQAVFIDEQGVSPSLEHDPHDHDYIHVVAYKPAGQPIGTGRLQPTGVIGRMAVLPVFRDWHAPYKNAPVAFQGQLIQILMPA